MVILYIAFKLRILQLLFGELSNLCGVIMIETSQATNKVNLSDYDSDKDIANRILLTSLTQDEMLVLEEILFSPLHLPLNKFYSHIDLPVELVQETLNKLLPTGLITITGDELCIDKEMRRYFDTHIIKLEENFKPGMEFLQNLLKNVPIHVLPNWYQIPRTSSNIFDSLIEKYMITPQIFQRYLLDLNLGNEVINAIANEVFNASNLLIPTCTLQEKYHLSDVDLHQAILILEYNFVCCQKFEMIDGIWTSVLTPFHEWKEYLLFLKSTVPQPVEAEELVTPTHIDEFAFINDMALAIEKAQDIELSLQLSNETEKWEPVNLHAILSKVSQFANPAYSARVIQKLIQLNLAEVEESRLVITPCGCKWTLETPMNRAIYVYRHHLNKIDEESLSHICSEKNIYEIEKSLSRVTHIGWIEFDEFMKGMTAPLNEHCRITLKKHGKCWLYSLPEYNTDEKAFIKRAILDWLYECGVIQIGSYQGSPTFRLTSFGKTLFQ
ncbi:MAG: hypothetical protein S4CHLAM102_12930 [Chlamydiia bacterium]|nr:hypothetical protein [Chlamydiia bacterium]